MLDFANIPPQGPEDITLSESGRALLENAHERSDDNLALLNGIGAAAFTKIFDAYGGETSMPRARGEFVFEKRMPDALRQATAILSNSELSAFVTGMDNIRVELSHRYLESRVPA